MKNSSWQLHVFKDCRITRNVNDEETIDVDIYIIKGGRTILRNHVS